MGIIKGEEIHYLSYISKIFAERVIIDEPNINNIQKYSTRIKRNC